MISVNCLHSEAGGTGQYNKNISTEVSCKCAPSRVGMFVQRKEDKQDFLTFFCMYTHNLNTKLKLQTPAHSAILLNEQK